MKTCMPPNVPPLQTKSRHLIPKLIHIVWVGDDRKRPECMIETWRAMNPNFKVRIWGNQDLERCEWQLKSQIDAWFAKEINGAADLMRWEILLKNGGVAVDADSICLRALEDWLLEPTCFAVWENELCRPGLIACGAMGCQVGNPLIRKIIDEVLRDQELMNGMAWQKVGPQRLTECVRLLNYSDITIYPSHYFMPDHFTGLHYTGSGPVFARQAWSSTFEQLGVRGENLHAGARNS